jgi:hypothetical protein
MDLNELMKGLFANLNIPKNNDQTQTGEQSEDQSGEQSEDQSGEQSNSGNKDSESTPKLPFDEDFLKNFLKNINLEDILKNMKVDNNVSEDTEICKECETDDSVIENNTVCDELEKDQSDGDYAEDDDDSGDGENIEDKNDISNKLKNIDLKKLGLGNMNLNNFDFSNLDINNLLSVFNFNGIGDNNTVEEKQTEENIDDYLQN